MNTQSDTSMKVNKKKNGLAKLMSIEWLGQTIASLCWIASVLVYGITSNGDWLQLMAASCWMLSNVASVLTVKGS